MNDQASLSTERVLRVLSDEQRRAVIDLLATGGGETTLDRLASDLDGAPAAASSERSRQRSLVELHHCHLPALAQADVVRYDAARGVVRRGEAFEPVRSLLESLDGHRRDEPGKRA